MPTITPIPKLAEQANENAAARKELFDRLAKGEAAPKKTWHHFASLQLECCITLIEKSDEETCVLIARALGNTLFASSQDHLYKAATYVLTKNPTGTAAIIAQLAASNNLTHVRNFSLLNTLVDRNPNEALKVHEQFPLTQGQQRCIQKRLISHFPAAFKATGTGIFSLDIDRLTKSTIEKRINVDPPRFGSLQDRDPRKRNELIQEHAARRVHLFFFTLVAFYNSESTLELNDTYFRYGKGTYDNPGCHSAILTSLKIKPKGAKTADPSIFFDLYIAHSCNSTVYLPKEVNEVDCALENTHVRNKEEERLRARSLKILNDVADPKSPTDPESGLHAFLEAFTTVADIVEKKFPARKEILDQQRTGTRWIVDQKTSKIADSFFRWNLLANTRDGAFAKVLKTKAWKDLTQKEKNTVFTESKALIHNQKVQPHVDGGAKD